MGSIHVWGQTIVYGLLKDGNLKILIFFVVLLNYIKSLIKNLSTYFIDDILYELHLYEKLKKIEDRNLFLNNAGNTQLIITIPSYIHR